MANNQAQVVIDASLAINAIFPAHPYHTQAQDMMRLWGRSNVQVLAPPLYESEADTAIRRYAYHGYLTDQEQQVVQWLLDSLPVNVVHDPRVRRRARQIAEEFNQQRVYDSTYAALAELTGCEFWTADQRFYEAVRSGLGYVRFLGNAR